MTEPQKKTCCLARRKIVVGILQVLPEEQCGVSELEVLEFMRFDLRTPAGTPVVSFRYCPWCGTERTLDTEFRVTEHVGNIEEVDEDDEDDEDEPWKDDS